MTSLARWREDPQRIAAAEALSRALVPASRAMERCPRNSKCLKAAGHAGWCQTKSKQGGQTQDDLFAAQCSAAPLGQKRSRQAPGAGRVAAMQELGRKREAKQGGKRRAGRLPSDDEEDDDDDDGEDEDGDEEDDWGHSSSGNRRGLTRVDDDDDDGVEYADYGMSSQERKKMRDRGRAPSNWEDDEEDDEGGPSEAAWSGPPAMLADLESIRLKRAVLEKWLLEPFFADLLPGCFVRIGLQIPSTSGPGPSTTLYRAAEVLEVKDLHDISHPPYPFAGKTTSKHLRLVFGEMTAWCAPSPHPLRRSTE